MLTKKRYDNMKKKIELAEEQIKEIAEELDCGMKVYLNVETNEIKSIIDFDSHIEHIGLMSCSDGNYRQLGCFDSCLTISKSSGRPRNVFGIICYSVI